MQTAAILLMVALGVAFIGRKMLRDAGLLKKKGDDCGCGKCATKARVRPR